MVILDKLEGLVPRFEEVSTLITDPSVIADQKRYVKLTREYKNLEDLMKARKEYLGLLANIKEGKEMLQMEDDPEMKDMLRQEIQSSEERIPVLEEEIKIMLIPADPALIRLNSPSLRRMPFWKSVVVRAEMRHLFLPETFSVCIPNTST